MTGFFDRLTAGQSAISGHSRQENAFHKIAAIKRHLETLLNARQGCSQSSPELGLRDFNGHDASSGDLLEQVSLISAAPSDALNHAYKSVRLKPCPIVTPRWNCISGWTARYKSMTRQSSCNWNCWSTGRTASPE